MKNLSALFSMSALCFLCLQSTIGASSFSAVEPNRIGRVSKWDIPIDDWLSLKFSQGCAARIGNAISQWTEDKIWDDKIEVRENVLNRTYGIEGQLKFDKPESIQTARLKHERKRKELVRLAYFESASHSWLSGKAVAGSVAYLFGRFAHPLDFALISILLASIVRLHRLAQPLPEPEVASPTLHPDRPSAAGEIAHESKIPVEVAGHALAHLAGLRMHDTAPPSENVSNLLSLHGIDRATYDRESVLLSVFCCEVAVRTNLPENAQGPVLDSYFLEVDSVFQLDSRYRVLRPQVQNRLDAYRHALSMTDTTLAVGQAFAKFCAGKEIVMLAIIAEIHFNAHLKARSEFLRSIKLDATNTDDNSRLR